MARRHRRYGVPVGINLGSYAGWNRSASTKDLLIGVAVGLAGAALAAFGLKKARDNGVALVAAPATGTDYLKMATPLVGGAALGYAAWLARKQLGQSASSAFGILVGAAASGAALALWPQVAATVGLAEYGIPVGLNVPLQGLLVDDTQGESNQGLLPGYSGLIVSDSPSAFRGYADRSGFARLAAASMDPDEDYSEMGRLASFANYRELDVEGQG
jgi:hypothetical protein